MAERTVTVLTQCVDIASLAEALVERVDENRLMLYAADPVDENEWVGFQVLLGDLTVAFSGRGLAVGSFDGGEDRPEEARFDIVLESLELSGSSDAVYDRILMMRGGGANTGEVNLAEVEAHEAAAAGGGLDRNFDEEPTRLGPVDLDLDVDVDGAPALAAHGLMPPDEEGDEPATAIAGLSHTEAVSEFETREHALPEGESDDEADYADADDHADVLAAAAPSERPPTSVRPAAGDDWGGLSPASDLPPAVPSERAPAMDDEWADVAEAAAAPMAGSWTDDPRPVSQAPAAYDVDGDDMNVEAVNTGEVERVPSVRPPSAPPARLSRVSQPARPKAVWEQDFASVVAQAGEEPLGAPVPGEPAPPAPFAVVTIAATGVVLSRPSMASSWDPASVVSHREARSSTGDFIYGVGELPIPAAPPRADGAAASYAAHDAGQELAIGMDERDFVEGEEEAF